MVSVLPVWVSTTAENGHAITTAQFYAAVDESLISVRHSEQRRVERMWAVAAFSLKFEDGDCALAVDQSCHPRRFCRGHCAILPYPAYACQFNPAYVTLAQRRCGAVTPGLALA